MFKEIQNLARSIMESVAWEHSNRFLGGKRPLTVKIREV